MSDEPIDEEILAAYLRPAAKAIEIKTKADVERWLNGKPLPKDEDGK